MKKCTKCNLTKEYSEFHSRKTSKDGFASLCKECKRIIAHNAYVANPEKYRAKSKEYIEKNYLVVRDKRNKYNKHYYSTEHGKRMKKLAKQRVAIAYRDKEIARMKLRQAVRRGKIIKPEICEINESICSGRIEGHHTSGYEGDNWKIVRWLCVKHHTYEHFPKIRILTNQSDSREEQE